MKPWEQRTDESDQAYQAFLIFRNLGPGRTFKRAFYTYRNLPDTVDVLVAPSYRDMTRRYQWKDRARAWDIYLQQQRDKEVARREALWERRRLETVDLAWSYAQKIGADLKLMADTPLFVRKVSTDGRTIEIHPADWSRRDVYTLMQLELQIRSAAIEAVSKDRVDDLTLAALNMIDEQANEQPPPGPAIPPGESGTPGS